MTDTLKVLGQLAPAAAALTALYTVPAATSAVVSTLTVCNTTALPATWRLSVAPAGAGDTLAQYLFYGPNVDPNDSAILSLGIGLAATDIIRVWASIAGLSFSAFGVQIT